MENTPEDSAAPADALNSTFDLIELDTATVTFFRTPGGTLRANIADPQLGGERTYLTVRVARAFPFSDPDRYIGLRDANDREIGVLVTLDGLAEESRALVREELERRYFLPKIEAVRDLQEERGGLVLFDVETDRGPRQFYIQNPREAIQSLTPTRLLMTDKDGLRYEFPDISLLDARTRAFLERTA